MNKPIRQHFFRKFPALFFLIIVLPFCLTSMAIDKGCSGTYFISGIAYSTYKLVLKNAALTMKFGKKTQQIITDKNGRYEIELEWVSPCTSDGTEEQHRQESLKNNPEFVFIIYKGLELKLKNEWEKYSHCVPESKAAITWKKDLYFK